jgi:hypothetical protein
MTTQSDISQQLNSAGFNGTIQESELKAVLEGVEVRSHATYEVEYGVNADNGKFVMHFYPPGYAIDNRSVWGDAWDSFHGKLEGALMEYFAVQIADGILQAGWVPELQSFYVISEKPRAVDFEAWLRSFFTRLEA